MKRIGTAGPQVRGGGPDHESSEKVFAADEIRRALPYVQRVLSDASQAYSTVQRIRRRLSSCPKGVGHVRLAEQRDEAVASLNRTIDECHAIGIAFIDIPNARVAFRVEIEGRLASVMWRLGDPLDFEGSDVAAAGHDARLTPRAAGSRGRLR